MRVSQAGRRFSAQFFLELKLYVFEDDPKTSAVENRRLRIVSCNITSKLS